MTIKEVEKLTGLTAKSIRYYESKGLLTVERNRDNDYRSYSELEVNRLKRIKLFRYLDFSVEEVKVMLDMDTKEVEKALEKKAEYFSDLRERCLDKKELCRSLAKEYKKGEKELNLIISDYHQVIENIESEELAEITEELKFLGAPSLSITILQTLMFLGPIMSLFMQISDGKSEDLMLLAGIAIFSTVLITGVWIFYFVQRSKNKNHVKKKNRVTIWILPMLILGIVLGIMLTMGLDYLMQKFLVPKNFLFYSYSEIAEIGLIVINMVTLVFVGGLLISKFSEDGKKIMEKSNGLIKIWNRLGKWKKAAIAVGGIAFYCCVTSFTVVTEDAVICHSPIHPMGIEYSYSDIEKIKAGVGQKTVSFARHERKGEFYYEIELDGRTIRFMTGVSCNSGIERYKEHTYLWCEEFDQKLVELGIPKESDSTGYENIDMGQEYVERFYRILQNY